MANERDFVEGSEAERWPLKTYPEDARKRSPIRRLRGPSQATHQEQSRAVPGRHTTVNLMPLQGDLQWILVTLEAVAHGRKVLKNLREAQGIAMALRWRAERVIRRTEHIPETGSVRDIRHLCLLVQWYSKEAACSVRPDQRRHATVRVREKVRRACDSVGPELHRLLDTGLI